MLVIKQMIDFDSYDSHTCVTYVCGCCASLLTHQRTGRRRLSKDCDVFDSSRRSAGWIDEPTYNENPWIPSHHHTLSPMKCHSSLSYLKGCSTDTELLLCYKAFWIKCPRLNAGMRHCLVENVCVCRPDSHL
jgi:hypothetical protein